MSTQTPAPRRSLHVLGALLLDTIRPGSASVRRDDFIGVRDFAELAANGRLEFRGTSLLLKLCRALVILPNAIGIEATSITVQLTIRFLGPSGPLAPPHRRPVLFDAQHTLARETVQLDALATSEFGMHGFEISADNEVLTIVPLLVVPHGTLASMQN